MRPLKPAPTAHSMALQTMHTAKALLTRKTLSAMFFLTALFLSVTAHAQLVPGAQAPEFKAQAALAGQAFEFDLQATLQKGPAVVYFYPKAFTSGCTIEAQLFAQSMNDFQALSATVVGVSGDDIDTLKKFSEGPCGGKFAVAADPDGEVIDLYDAGFAIIPGMADRISYAIAPDGTILEAFESMSPAQHVTKTLDAIRTWHTTASGQGK